VKKLYLVQSCFLTDIVEELAKMAFTLRAFLSLYTKVDVLEPSAKFYATGSNAR
jgi:hypothetical protein